MWIFPKEVVIIDRTEGKQYTNRPINMDNIVTFDDSIFCDGPPAPPPPKPDHSNENSGYHIVHEDPPPPPPRHPEGMEGLASIQFKLSNGEGFHWVYPTPGDRDIDIARITDDLKAKKK